MGLATKFRQKLRTFMQRPGSTVSLAPFEALLPRIEELEEELKALSDDELKARAIELGDRLTGASEAADDGEPDESPEYVDSLQRAQPVMIDDDDLVEICALGREAARRALDERAFDTQLLGAMSMLAGTVVEMATGEGKTLAAAIAAFGYASRGARVQIMTVNDYLAHRDAEWMRPVYELLGLTVGSIGETSTHDERAAAYACDVTYASVSEAGFDFLRDQLVTSKGDEVMPGLATLILDEADFILIDEARVPLVLAGSVE
ncbi:MAG: hypothetical protein HOU81_18470, partial [Hamadaea sp.]|nr:hypothetical protein [Hamadaea sp.]